MRGYLTTYVNFCWGIGQEIGIGVIMSMLKRDDEWAYRIPYALQWMWPVPLAVGIAFAPESPWWLVRKNRIPEASGAYSGLAGAEDGTTNAATRPIGINEEGSDASRVVGWIESGVFCT